MISGKIVINGSFKSVKEVNVNEFLSIDFKPSSIESLAKSIQFGIENFDFLKEKYKNNISFTSKELSYKSHVSILEN